MKSEKRDRARGDKECSGDGEHWIPLTSDDAAARGDDADGRDGRRAGTFNF
jgi:hypothetical protein